MTPAQTDSNTTPTVFTGLAPVDRQQLRALALRYRVRRDTTLRPLADVRFDLRSRHGLRLSMGQVLELVSRRAGQ